jgi:Protein of unknown function DUF262
MAEETVYPFNNELREEEEKSSLEDDHADLPPNDIVAYNELRSCADIVRMWRNRQLTIKPDFQRDVVWKKPDQTRLIDSLIKQLPIPSMCISLDFNTNERLVIDGLQRISTIISFLTNDEYQLSELDDIDTKISGKTVAVIKSKNKTLYDRVENLTIPITVLRCDYEKKTHMDYLFTIFHRLNSGGTKLNNQEIRNCIYNGKLNSLLKSTVKYPNYKNLFNIEDDKTYRFAFEELNLRYFAFSEWLDKYNGRLAKFLNDYMFEKEKNPKGVKITDKEIEEKRKSFQKTIDLTYTKVYNNQSAENVSKSVIEAVLIGVNKNSKYVDSITIPEAQVLLEKLRQDPLFSVDSLKEGLSQKAKVTARIKKAIEIFSGK